MAAKWQKWWSYILKSCENYKKIAERKKKKKKKANKQTRRTNKPGGTGIRQNQTNGVRNTQSKHQILSLQQIIFVHQVVKGLLRSKVNKI